MYTTAFLFRLIKTVAVAGIAVMASLIAFGNITDYNSNFQFVAHVMKMDTTFNDSNLHYRSIDNVFAFHAFYLFIILMQVFMAFCCVKGSWLLLRSLRRDAVTFHASKNWAIAGIGIGIMIWFIGFEVIGGEWFAMWQSTEWNGLAAAQRVLSFLVLTLILLHFKDE
jgi:predicted small integral membrane protein